MVKTTLLNWYRLREISNSLFITTFLYASLSLKIRNNKDFRVWSTLEKWQNSSWHDNNGIIYSQASSSEYVSGAGSTFSIFCSVTQVSTLANWIGRMYRFGKSRKGINWSPASSTDHSVRVGPKLSISVWSGSWTYWFWTVSPWPPTVGLTLTVP